MHSKRFPAKLLLFGEYTLLNGSRALAMPVRKWGGRLEVHAFAEATARKAGRSEAEIPTEQSERREVQGTGVQGTGVQGTGVQGTGGKAGGRERKTEAIGAFVTHILSLDIFPGESTRQLRKDLEQGLTFISDIPQGYGVGSSGALCAAFWDRYGQDIDDLAELRTRLARMEDYFHGTSSGLDPLVSFLNSPVLYEGDRYGKVILPADQKPRIFLIDSGAPHDTGALVARYREWCSDEAFQVDCLRPLQTHVDHAIQFLLDGQWSVFYEHLQAISLLQFTYFKAMIPDHILPLWERSLSSPDYFVKLCGAGGGGFFLGIASTGAEDEIGDKVTWIDW